MQEAQKKGQVVLIGAIVVFAAVMVLMFPQARNFIFHRGQSLVTGASASAQQETSDGFVVETPRTMFPMAQFTTPKLYKKMRFATDTGGVKRLQYYYWFGPQVSAYPAGTKFPLVVVLHDKAGMDYGAVYLRMSAVQKEFPSFVLIPQSPAEKVWSSPSQYSGKEPQQVLAVPMMPKESQSMPDVLELLARLTAAYPIDETKLYVIGCGDGGTGVYGTAVDYPGIFAAGVAMNAQWSYTDARKLSATPLLILHGVQNPVVPVDFARTLYQFIKHSGGNSVYYAEFNDGTEDCAAPKFYTRAIWQWLFSQQRKAPASP